MIRADPFLCRPEGSAKVLLLDLKLFCSALRFIVASGKVYKTSVHEPEKRLLGDLASIVYPASLVHAFTPDRASIFTLLISVGYAT